MKYVTGFIYFWYDFLVGDAWEVALGVVIALAVAAVLIRAQPTLAVPLGPLLALVVVLLMGGSLFQVARGQ